MAHVMGLVDSLTCLFEQVGRANLSNSINDQVHAMELLLDGWVHELQELSGRAKWMRDEVCFSSPPHLSPDLWSLQPTSSALVAIGALSQIFRWHSCFQPVSGRLRSWSGTAFKMSISPITNHQSSITNHQSPIINHQLSITNHQSPITNHQSPIINHQSSIINHQSPWPKLEPRGLESAGSAAA
jgi:hypothetical protein